MSQLTRRGFFGMLAAIAAATFVLRHSSRPETFYSKEILAKPKPHFVSITDIRIGQYADWPKWGEPL